MIDEFTESNARVIVVKPNKSSTWRANLYVLIAISTSGNSANVLRAVDAAHAAGSAVIGLSGKLGGELDGKCDISVVVPSDVTARIQEMHIVIGHLICALIEEHLELGGH